MANVKKWAREQIGVIENFVANYAEHFEGVVREPDRVEGNVFTWWSDFRYPRPVGVSIEPVPAVAPEAASLVFVRIIGSSFTLIRWQDAETHIKEAGMWECVKG